MSVSTQQLCVVHIAQLLLRAQQYQQAIAVVLYCARNCAACDYP
jgi:hypothetical protein